MRFAFWIACVFAFPVSAAEPVDALAELNADRAKHGLYPYVRDEALTQAAATLAAYRAEHRIAGHVHDRPMGDFAFLVGLKVDATGCAAWADGFGACEMRGSTYKMAGAAKARGADGLFYCHLVLRKGPPTSATTVSFREPASAKATAPAAKTVHCIQYTDATKTKIAKEWDEPAPAWLSNGGACAGGQCATTATRMPATIQGSCPSGNCPNAKR